NAGYDCYDTAKVKPTSGDVSLCKKGFCSGPSTRLCCPESIFKAAAASGAVTDINSESSYLPEVQEQESSVPSLITGFAPAATATQSATYSGQAPVYDKYLQYEKGDWSRLKNAKSDCEFVDLGRSAIQSMYKFYNGKDGSGSAQDRAACEAPHKPQPACCPFEYKSEWGWGMMFSDEVTNSYCLAIPESEECGTGTKIVNGVTGICQPTSSAPQARLVVLDGLKWNNVLKKYPKPSAEMIGDEVVYMVDLDEKGNPKSVKRGYYSKTEVESVSGTASSGGRVKVSTGSYFVPESSEDFKAYFPTMDNTDIRNEKEVKNGAKQFMTNLAPLINDGLILSKISSKPKPGDFKDTDYDNWYRQVAGLIGQPGRQYLAQPEGSFVQSLITLCLSGIATWIVMLKNMLTQLAICFQTILVTGDGSSGQCQQLISQYVCDLIKEAISCLVQRFGGGASARVGIGGIGGFFSSVADASRSVTQEAQSRYGDKNILSSTFAAENLMHDACIFMFTGEWPTDWGKLFQSAAYLPVNSSALILRPTRRYQVYDPSTGFARYVYRIGYSVFAGADINFKLELVCSSGACTDGSNGKCDCGQADLASYTAKGRTTSMAISLHGTGNCPSNGNLGKLQSCTDEILFVGQGYYPLRYDTVRLSYTPTQATGTGRYGGSSTTTGLTGGTGLGGVVSRAEAVSGSYETKITEIGGPPYGLCDFDITQLAFRCGVSVSATGTATFLSAELTKASNQYYGIGDSDIARVKIAQKLPANAASCTSDCEYTKYLVIKEIKNQAGAVVYPKSSKIVGERLNQEKVWDLNVFSDTYFPATLKESKESFVIKAEDFGKQAPGACSTPLSDLAKTTTGLNKIAIQNIGCSKVSSTNRFAIVINYDGDTTFTYQYYSNSTSGQWTPSGSASACSKITVESTDKGDYTMSCGDFNITVLGDYVRTKGNVISPGSKALSSKAVKGVAAYLYTPPASTTTSLTCASQPEKWTMTLEIRDAVSTAGSYSMADTPSVDSESGEKQTKTLTFNVLCKQSTTATVTSGSIKDIVSKTVSVTSDNNVYNKTYGMWVPDYQLGPTESIKVSDFEWISSAKPEEGFKISIDSTAANGVLNIDLTSLNVIPGNAFQVEKISSGSTSGTVLKTCGTAPCVQSIGTVNSRILTLRIAKGDPTFKFTGFQGAEGLQTISSQEIKLDKTTTSALNGNLKVASSIPDGIAFYFKNYIEGSDSVSIDFKSNTTLLDVTGFGFTLSDKFDASKATASIGSTTLESCEKVSDKRSDCYLTSTGAVAIRTLGHTDWVTLNISGLQAVATSTTSSLKDLSTGQTITLTSSSSTQYGVTVTGIDTDAKVSISSIVADVAKGTIDFRVVTSGQKTSPVKISIEVLPLGLNGNSNTKDEISGQIAALEDCESSYSKPCVASKTGDRVILNVNASTDAMFRISGLAAASGASKECSGKSDNAECTISGTLKGTCWTPSILGATMQCYSDCKKSYIQANLASLDKDKLASLPAESNFCIAKTSYCSSGAAALAGLCGSGDSYVCCQDGKGGTAVPTSSGKGGAVSGSGSGKPGTRCGSSSDASEKYYICVPDSKRSTDCEDGTVVARLVCGSGTVCCKSKTGTVTMKEDEACASGAVCMKQGTCKGTQATPYTNVKCENSGDCCMSKVACMNKQSVAGLTLYSGIETTDQSTGVRSVQDCATDTYCVPGYTGSKSNCVGVSSQAFL
ncbi:hypothetical protein KY363_06515, partial [Candidatus Woesearchaeota archaeon]|nr:hypothetical protein [Candidatus Woesearchaeota archaeon]